MNEKILIFILVMHYLCDFVLQTDWQAKNKYNNQIALAWHAATYSMIFGIASLVIFPIWTSFIPFMIWTFVLHFFTDGFTSTFTHKFFIVEKNTHHGFAVVGFDQILHYVQLYITIKLLL